jgi:hypothetical protein
MIREELEARARDKQYQALDRTYRKLQMKARLREMQQASQAEEKNQDAENCRKS